MTLDKILLGYNARHSQARIDLTRSEGEAIILALSGDLEMKVSSDIAPVLESALLECPARGRIVLDLSRVGYVSSTGVGLLATTMMTAGKRSIGFVLRDIPQRVQVIMDTLGLLSFFDVEKSGE